MSIALIMQDLRALGVTLEVRGDKLRVDAPSAVMTSELRQTIQAHKAEILAELSRNVAAIENKGVRRFSKQNSHEIHDNPVPPKNEPPPYIHRCPQCNSTNWGPIRTELETLADGETREFEVWGCLACSALASGLGDVPVPEETGHTAQCPECSGSNIVVDSVGKYCVDCRRRPWERKPSESSREPEPIYVGVKWSQSEMGYLELTNPLTGEVVEVVAKGLPKWLFERLNK